MMNSPADISDFIQRWRQSDASERANYQLFLTELCDVLGVQRPEPVMADNRQNAYVFERAVTFQHGDGSSSTGFIDLYRRACFVLEAKQGSQAAQQSALGVPVSQRTTRRKTGPVKQAWPKTLPEQVQAVRGVLGGQPLALEQIAAQFKNAKRERVGDILATLAALGQARDVEDGRFTAG